MFVDPAAGGAFAYCHTATFGQSKDVPSWHEDESVVAAVDGDVYDAVSHAQTRTPAIRSPQAGAVVAGFEANKAGFPEGIDGVFSLFLWDRRARTLYISSDPIGHKLVYYYAAPGGDLLVFSTELKAVLAHPSVPRELDQAVLPAYLSAGFVSAPFTLARGVRKLRPAECISFGPTETRTHRFWRPTLETGPDDFDYWVQRTRSELVSAVGRTVADAKKVAVYLSGGVDSSVVLAALREGGQVDSEAFSLAYTQHGSEYDIDWAKHVARVLGVPHQVVHLDPESEMTPGLMSTLVKQIDEPFDSATRVLNEYILGKACLAAGFDSTINGSSSLLFNLRRARERANLAFESLDETLANGLGEQSYFKGERMESALAKPADLTIRREASLTNRELLQDLDFVQAETIGQAIRFSASRSTLFYQYIPPLLGLEQRTPFTDSQLLSFAVSVPAKFRGLDSEQFDKALLKECFRDALQVDFNQRELRGYPSPPLPAWLRQMLVPSLKPLVDDGLMRATYLTWLDKNVKLGRKRAEGEAWLWFVFNCWYEFQIKRTDPFARVS